MSIRYHHLEVRGGPSFKNVCVANNRISYKSASETILVTALVLMRTSVVNYLNFLKKKSILVLFFYCRFDNSDSIEKPPIDFVLSLPGID